MNKIILIFLKKNGLIKKTYKFKFLLVAKIVAYILKKLNKPTFIWVNYTPEHLFFQTLTNSNEPFSHLTYLSYSYGDNLKSLLDNCQIQIYDFTGDMINEYNLENEIDLKVYNELTLIAYKTIGFNKIFGDNT